MPTLFAAIAIATLALLCGRVTSAATTGELIQREGLASLLFGNEAPDCVCKYCCPDYCKKPMPCPCGPLPPNLSCGCGPKRPWAGFSLRWGSGGAGCACCDPVSGSYAAPIPGPSAAPPVPSDGKAKPAAAAPTPAARPKR